ALERRAPVAAAAVWRPARRGLRAAADALRPRGGAARRPRRARRACRRAGTGSRARRAFGQTGLRQRDDRRCRCAVIFGRRGPLSRATTFLGILVLATSLLGCAQYYWSRPNGSGDDFARENLECARQAAPNPAG